MINNILNWVGGIFLFLFIYMVIYFWACMDAFAPTTNPILRFIIDALYLTSPLGQGIVWIIGLLMGGSR